MMNQNKTIDKKKFYKIHLVDFGQTTSYKDED